MTLRVRAGEHVGILAAEDAGASTLLAVLAGLATDYSGSATLDGVSLRDLDRADHVHRVALVGDRPGVFDGTIEENIVLGRPDVSARDVQHALDVAGLAAFVHESPDGLRTRVGGATHVPAEIVWRIALARAVAGRPSLLLLDEFFRHIDPARQPELVARLLARDAGWTVIGVSHVPICLGAVDRVVVLERGRIAREGTLARVAAAPAERALVHTTSLDVTAV